MKKKLSLYIATSLDGFIARKNGSVDWLTKYENTKEDYGYKEFLNSIGIVVLGNTTYKQFKAPYPNKKCFVFSRKNTGKVDNITYTNSDVNDFISELGENDGNIWLVGGADIIKEFLKNNLIDEFIITVIPVVLGGGIPLFAGGKEHQLKLQSTISYDSGVVQLCYQSIPPM